VTATWVGGDAATANSTAVTVTISGSAQAGDIAYIAAPYNPALGTASISGGGGAWSLACPEVTWSSSFHAILYRRTLTAGDIGATITIANTGSQKLTAALGILRGVTAQDSFATANETAANIVTSHAAPSFAAGTTDVALAFWTERESAPSSSVTAPSGFTLRNSAFATGSGATAAAVASNLTPVAPAGTVGGGNWGENVANDAVVMFVVGLTVDPAVNAAAAVSTATTITAVASVVKNVSASLTATATIAPAGDPIPQVLWRGGDAQTFNGTAVTVTIPAGARAGDIGLIAHPYAPSLGDTTTPAGWTQLDSRDFGASFRGRLYYRILGAGEGGSTVTFTNTGAQKLAATLGVLSGSSGIDVNNFIIESTITASHTAPSATAVTSDVAVAFITERESTPSTVWTPPSGFTLRQSAFNVGGGATCVGVATNLSPVAPAGTVGGGTWGSDVANDAVIMWIVGLSIAPVDNTSASRTTTATITADLAIVRSATAALTITAAPTAGAARAAGPATAARPVSVAIAATADVIAGTPPPVFTIEEDPPARKFRIEVFDENLKKMGRVGRYLTADLVLKHLAIGSWAILMNSDEPAAALLAEPGRRVTIDFEDDGTRLLSGPVDTFEEISEIGGQRTIAFAGYDDTWWLDQRVAYPTPDATFPAEGVSFTQPNFVDIRSGTGEGVAKAFITANAVDRYAIPHFTVAPNLGRGSLVSFNARMHSLLWMVTISTTYSGVGFTVDQVGNQLVFDVYVPQVQPVRLSTRLGNLAAYRYKVLSPIATDAVGGGTGEGTLRKYMRKSLPGSATGWGHREKYVDLADAANDSELSTRISDFLAQSAPTAGFSLTPRDTRSMRFGRDYNVGDRVTVELPSGLQVADTVREVRLSHTSADGVVITPGIGYSESTDPNAEIYRRYGALRDEVANMKRRV
jgi:hypothetical protein